MAEIGPTVRGDDTLLAYLEARDEADAEAALELLLCRRANPLVREVMGRKLRVGGFPSSDINEQDAEDLVGDITLRLVKRLRILRSNESAEPIENFRGYVAVTAYHACDQYLRRKYPRRYSLKNQLRYILTHRAGLALWENDEGVRLCGFAAWRNGPPAAAPSSVQRILTKPQLIAEQVGKSAAKLSPPDLLAAIFDCLRGPLELDQLVSIVAELWQIKEAPAPQTISDGESPGESIPAGASGQIDLQIDQSNQLEQLWVEIGALPLRQRVALLLNLKDPQGRSGLALFPLLRIASIRQIAQTLEMPAEGLATLWNQLPLEDQAIAEYLGLRRQQVINLRKCARERLRRRTREFR